MRGLFKTSSAIGVFALIGLVASAHVAFAAAQPTLQDLATMDAGTVQQWADKGMPAAQLEMASRYAGGAGVEKDEQKAIAIVKGLVDKKNPHAMYMLGAAYWAGIGVGKDDAQATHWFQEAAHRGDRDGMHYLGVMIGEGRSGAPANWAKAKPWLEKAALRGDSNAAQMVGWIYEKGKDVKKDPNKAADWYRRAIVMDDNLQAQWSLSLLIESKLVTPKPGDPGAPQISVQPKAAN